MALLRWLRGELSADCWRTQSSREDKRTQSSRKPTHAPHATCTHTNATQERWLSHALLPSSTLQKVCISAFLLRAQHEIDFPLKALAPHPHRHPAVAATAAARCRGRGSTYDFVSAVAAVTAVTMRLAGLARPRREKGQGHDDYGFDTRRVEFSGAASMLFRVGEDRWALRGMCALFCLVFSTMEKRWTRLRPRPPRTHVGALAKAEADISRLLLRPVGDGTVALAEVSSEAELWAAFLEQEVGVGGAGARARGGGGGGGGVGVGGGGGGGQDVGRNKSLTISSLSLPSCTLLLSL